MVRCCSPIAQSCLAVRLDTASAYSAEASTHSGKSRALFFTECKFDKPEPPRPNSQTTKSPEIGSPVLSLTHTRTHTCVHTCHSTYQTEPQGELTILRQRVSRLERGTCGPGRGPFRICDLDPSYDGSCKLSIIRKPPTASARPRPSPNAQRRRRTHDPSPSQRTRYRHRSPQR